MIKDHEKHKLKLQQEQEKRKRKYVEKICAGKKKKKLPDFDYQGNNNNWLKKNDTLFYF